MNKFRPCHLIHRWITLKLQCHRQCFIHKGFFVKNTTSHISHHMVGHKKRSDKHEEFIAQKAMMTTLIL
jgi:hypothetical protein